MTKTSDTLNQLFGVIFFANKEYGASNHLNVESKSLADAAGKAKETTKGTATGKEIDAFSRIFRILFKDGMYYGCHGVLGILCSVQVAKILAAIFWQTLWGCERSPQWGFSWVVLD